MGRGCPCPFRTELDSLYGYPIGTVIAEKLSTAIALGDLNTRDHDYADLHQLITRHHPDGDELTTTALDR